MGYSFISYCSKQQNDANRLRLLLHSNHIDTWMAPYDIPDDCEYADVINNVIQNAACVVLLLTKDTQNSIYVDKEIERALHYGKTIAPIQLDYVVLNDSFSFYLCNQQIVMVPAIDASLPQIQSLLQHLYLLCNNKLPAKEDPLEQSRDKRVKRQRISRFLVCFGVGLLCFSLFCGYRYVDMCSSVTYMEMYGMEFVPELSQMIRSYAIFFFLAIVATWAYLYGHGLRDPKKKTWNPFRILPRRKMLPVFSALCGTGFAMLSFLQQAVAKTVRGLGAYNEPTEGYIPPQWVVPVRWTFAIVCIAAALLSFILALVHDRNNGYGFIRNLHNKLRAIPSRWKKEG